MNIIPLFCENARERIFQTPHVVYALRHYASPMLAIATFHL